MSEQELYNKIIAARDEAIEHREKYLDSGNFESLSFSHSQIIAYNNVINWFNEYLEGDGNPDDKFVVEHGYIKEVEMTEEEKAQWYIDNCSKAVLAKMLAYRDKLNKIIDNINL